MNARQHFGCAILATSLAFVVVRAEAANVHTRTAISIPMRDGKSIAADLYRPTETTGPWPTILIQTPYNKDTFATIFLLPLVAYPLKNQNYAVVITDWRGFFDSADAAYQGAPSLGLDGYDAVEWIATQSWSDTHVDTWGPSALGTVQLLTALQQPPHLDACVPMVCHVGDSYDLWYPGGVYYQNRNDFIATYFFLGTTLYRDHPTRDTFWMASDLLNPSYTGVETPMLFQTGWYDHESARTIKEFNLLRAAQGANSPTRLLVGPWTHGGLGLAEQGDLQYPAAEYEDARSALAFFDEHLRGIEPTAPPPTVRYFRINEDAWATADAWPPTSTETQALYFGATGDLTNAAPPAASSGVTFTSDPLDPVPTLYGALLQPSDSQTQGPGNIASLVAREDTVLFATEPLAEPLRLEGEHTARVWIEADAPDVDVAARLVQVRANGDPILLVDGIRRASLRGSFSTRVLLQTGVPVEVPIEFPPLVATIPAGDRLGVMIAGSNYDLFSVNPQDGNSYVDNDGAVPRSATITILTDETHPTRLMLSVTAEGNDGWMVY